MIPPSIFGPESFAPQGATDTFSSNLPAMPGDGGNDFSSFISDALDNNSGNSSALTTSQDSSPEANGADAWTNPCAGQSNTIDSSDTSTDDVQDARLRNERTRAGQKDKNGIDSTTVNNLSALLSQPGGMKPELDATMRLPVGAKVTADKTDKSLDPILDGNGNSAVAQALQTASNQAAEGIAASKKGSKPELAPPEVKDSNTAATPEKAAATANAQTPPAQTEPVKPVTQAAILQSVTAPSLNPNLTGQDAGTSAALDTQRMKSTGQKDENAGRAVQKLPHGPGLNGNSGDAGARLAGGLGTTGSARKAEMSNFSSTMDLTTPTVTESTRGSSDLNATGTADSNVSQVERVAKLVMQEVTSIRQSGATSLAVSLKVDPHTELFVQLSSHQGQIQASLRCERGSLAGLEGHWDQLRESLSRQNVQLQSPDERTFSRNGSALADSKNFEQPAQNQQNRGLAGDAPLPARPAKAAGARTAKNQTSSGQGWESWA